MSKGNWRFVNLWRRLDVTRSFCLLNVYWFPEMKGIVICNFMLEYETFWEQ